MYYSLLMVSPVKIWRNQKKIQKTLGKKGVIVCWTVVRVPPADFSDQAPYAVCLVQFEDGQRLLCQIVDTKTEDISEGMSVISVLRKVRMPDKDGVVPYGVKVKKE